MSAPRTRREFLADVARGAIAAGVGTGLAGELGFRLAEADDAPATLSFGAMDELVALMQETPLDRLLPTLVERRRKGTDARTLLAAGALANARTFGGEDYVGFHTGMAMAPAWRMSLLSSEPTSLLPILKVLHRNTARIHEFGGRAKEVLRPVAPRQTPEARPAGAILRDAVRAQDVDAAEGLFAAAAQGTPESALDALLWAVEDEAEVHRVVLPYRAYDLLEVVGAEHAHTMLRQSVRYCAPRGTKHGHGAAEALAKALEGHGLLGREPGGTARDDAWVEATSRAIFEASPEQAAELAAATLAEGTAPAAVLEAVSLAANQLLLRDAGRSERETRPGKPVGSVHGDSIGLHASDSANAWRNLARLSGGRNAFACAILGAWQVASDRVSRGGDFLHWEPRPSADEVAAVEAKEPDALLREADAAIRAKDQRRACAVVRRWADLGHPEKPVFDLLLRYATSEDGQLHAEKYFGTVTEEFAATRPAFRWRHVVALARVTASESGQPAPAHAEAVRLLAS